MNRFVRLIFIILALSIVAGLTVVLLANVHSARQQTAQVALESRRFGELLQRLDNRLRRAELAVEWQKVDADGSVTETSLFVRQFLLTADGDAPLPVERVAFPGNEVRMDAVILEFNDNVPPDFAAARGKRLALFGHVFGPDQPKTNQFSFLVNGEVPAAARVHTDHVTHHETVFWNILWDNMRNAEKQLKPSDTAPVRITWLPSSGRIVRRGLLYTATVAPDGVAIKESDDRRTLNEIRTDAEHLNSASRPG